MNNKFYLTLVLAASMLLFNCSSKDDPEEIILKDPTTITTKVAEITAVFSEIITGGTIIVGNDDYNINEKGVVWSKNQNPTINDTKLVYGGNDNNFSLTIVELEESTTYYVRAYIYIF